MKLAIEVERKFLIKLPLSQEAKEIIIDNADAPAHIVQTYLESNGDTIDRVRMISVEMWGRSMPTHYSYTMKRFISAGINEETEISIRQAEYVEFLMKSDESKDDIEKTRYFITWAGKLFELDLFHGAHDGLAILEIELTSMDDLFELPPFLEVIREVTGEKEYSNVHLAGKKY